MFGKKPRADESPQTPPSSGTEATGGQAPSAPRPSGQPAPGATPNLPMPQQKSAVARQGAHDLMSPDAMRQQQEMLAQRAEGRTVSYVDQTLATAEFARAKRQLIESVLEKIDFRQLEGLPIAEKKQRINDTATREIERLGVPLTAPQQQLLREQLLDEVLGFGPLEVLLNDADVSDIMVNTYQQTYIEKHGKIILTDVKFMNERHLLNNIQKVVQRVGRRIDESSPMVDARMPDGSRFNAIIPPLALDGSLVSIRKFKKNKMPLKQYVEYGSMSPEMVRFLEICGTIRINIIISGGTGSGKTTLLNAMSGHIDAGERVVTIEDAAELQMHQPHVLRLETRPPNMEGVGEVTQRALVKNALRMRPDRIILGEIRGSEVVDVLQAMNTGHDGSMATIHANNPRDCLTRLENLFGMAGMNLPIAPLRQQLASAIHLVVQISRMRDGVRRITHIEEVVGMEGDVITTQTLFSYKLQGIGEDGKMIGQFMSHGVKPRFTPQAAFFGLDKEIMRTIGLAPSGM